MNILYTQKKKKNPSWIRRDAKRLQAYLERKNATKPVESLVITGSTVISQINSSKAGHRNERPLVDVQPTSADEPLPHLAPKPISKTSARSVTAEQMPTSSQHPTPVTPEQQPSHLATKKVDITDFQQELDGADVSYEMRDGVPGLLCVKWDKHDWIPI